LALPVTALSVDECQLAGESIPHGPDGEQGVVDEDVNHGPEDDLGDPHNRPPFARHRSHDDDGSLREAKGQGWEGD
jgi:hypothetical protein